MTREQMNRDAEELYRIMDETVGRETKIYALAVILWHILDHLRREKERANERN